jgi:hypothetical protein
MARLITLPLRGAQAVALEVDVEGQPVYLCSRHRCPHWTGQPGLFADTDTMHCAAVGYAPARTCQPFYAQQAEHIDAARRDLWARLDAALDHEAKVTAAVSQTLSLREGWR